MQIFLAEELVLYAVPKTGSTALEDALRSRCSIELPHKSGHRHIPASHFQRIWAPFLKSTYGFEGEGIAVIRDPLERLGSWYRYLRRLDPSNNPRSTRNMSFDDFLEADLSGDVKFSKFVGNQRVFVSDEGGRICVTHLFAYDAFSEAVAFLRERFNKSLNVEQVNVSPEQKLNPSLELIGRVHEARVDEFALYDRVAESGYLHTPAAG